MDPFKLQLLYVIHNNNNNNNNNNKGVYAIHRYHQLTIVNGDGVVVFRCSFPKLV